MTKNKASIKAVISDVGGVLNHTDFDTVASRFARRSKASQERVRRVEAQQELTASTPGT